MEQKRTIDLMRRIHMYARGALPQTEADRLWIEFLKAPEWLDMLEIELHLLHMSSHAEKDN